MSVLWYKTFLFLLFSAVFPIKNRLFTKRQWQGKGEEKDEEHEIIDAFSK